MKLVTAAAVAAVIVAAVPALGSAQGSAADTLRYRERTHDEMVILLPQADLSVATDHDVEIGFVRISDDSAHAWYERIDIVSHSPMGRQQPDASAALGQLFVLRFEDDGNVTALTTPTFPDALTAVTDLRHQFVDFFMPPADEPLRVGMTWSDTLVISGDGETGVGGVSTHAADYRVVADTTHDGVSAFVVESSVQLEMLTNGPVPDQPGLTMRMELAGPETNTFWIARDDGRLLRRERDAELTGTLTYIGGPQPVELEVRRTYTNVIELVI